MNMHWYIDAEMLWCSEVSEGKSCIWIWTCIFRYDDWFILNGECHDAMLEWLNMLD